MQINMVIPLLLTVKILYLMHMLYINNMMKILSKIQYQLIYILMSNALIDIPLETNLNDTDTMKDTIDYQELRRKNILNKSKKYIDFIQKKDQIIFLLSNRISVFLFAVMVTQ